MKLLALAYSMHYDGVRIWGTDWYALMELRGARIRRFITAFPTTRHRSLSWATWIQSTPPQPVSLRSILIASSHRFSEWSFSFGLSHQHFVHFCLLSHACHMLCSPRSPWLDLPNDIWGWVQIVKLLIVHVPALSRHIIPRRSKYITAVASE
jgi:hypothetical protein